MADPLWSPWLLHLDPSASIFPNDMHRPPTRHHNWRQYSGWLAFRAQERLSKERRRSCRVCRFSPECYTHLFSWPYKNRHCWSGLKAKPGRDLSGPFLTALAGPTGFVLNKQSDCFDLRKASICLFEQGDHIGMLEFLLLKNAKYFTWWLESNVDHVTFEPLSYRWGHNCVSVSDAIRGDIMFNTHRVANLMSYGDGITHR